MRAYTEAASKSMVKGKMGDEVGRIIVMRHLPFSAYYGRKILTGNLAGLTCPLFFWRNSSGFLQI